MLIGDGVKLLRTKQNLSARALSAKAGLSPTYIFKLESGLIDPSVTSFAKIVLALGMNRYEVWTCLMDLVKGDIDEVVDRGSMSVEILDN